MNHAPRLNTAFARASFARRAETERLAEQLAFARDLLALHPGELPDGAARLDDAEARALAAAGSAGADAFARAARGIEADLADFARLAKTYTIHAAGHAHIDMNWMWGWAETVSITHDTFQTVLRLMEEFPEFHFTQSQGSCYKIVEDYHPALLERIAARVREGRWEVAASHWVENDSNLAGPLALCRHLELARRYCAERFGLTPGDVPLNWAPDTFGHAARTPSYLARGGVRYQYLHRPGVHTPRPRRAFWWEAGDGARVLVFNGEDVGYNARLGPHLRGPLLDFARETGLRRWLLVYGVGDHGGGPTRRDLLRAREMNAWPVFPNVEPGRARDWFEYAEREGGAGLPTIRGELNTAFAGCYTAQALIKRDIRTAENRLADAELAAATAGAAARLRDPRTPAWPAERVREAWRDTLFGHFHDILPGSCARDAVAYHHGRFQDAMATATVAAAHAWRSFAAQVAPAEAAPDAVPGAVGRPYPADDLGAGVGYNMNGHGGQGIPGSADRLPGAAGAPDADGVRRFVAFNPTAHDREEVIEVTLWDDADPTAPARFGDRPFRVRHADPSWPACPAQRLEAGHYWAHDNQTVAVPVRVPAFGYAAFAVEPDDGRDGRDEAKRADGARPDGLPEALGAGAKHVGAAEPCFYMPPESPVEGIENAFLRVVIEPRTGAIRALVDKRSGLTLAGAPADAPALEYAVEAPSGGSAWIVGPPNRPGPATVLGVARPHNGPWTAALDVDLACGASRFTLRYELRAGEPRLRVRLRGTWFERGTKTGGVPQLRWRLPTALADARATAEIPFGALERSATQGEELPALEWTAVTGAVGGAAAGVIVANDSKYGYSLDGGDYRLTLLRASHGPDPLPDVAEHEVRWTVEPFAGPLSPGRAFRAARSLNHPLVAVPSSKPADDAAAKARHPAVGRFLRWSGGELCGLAPAEGGDGLVAHVYETEGVARTFTLDFADSPLGAVTDAERFDLNGRPLGPVPMRDRATVEVPLAPYDIAAVHVRFAP